MLRNLVKSLILLASAVLASCQEDMIVSVDPTVTVSSIKPMNAANNGPVKANMDSYTALQIPYARTHDAALTEVYVAKYCVDISAVFPDWDVKVDDPASYDFVNTDVLIANMLKSGAKPFYRLIQSIPSQKAEPIKRWIAQVASLSKKNNPTGFAENRTVAKAGGKVAKQTRDNMEAQLGRNM